MWEPLKRLVAAVLRLDLAPPTSPTGRAPRVFQAAPAFLTYRLIPFWIGVAFQVIGAGFGLLALHAAAAAEARKGNSGLSAVVHHPAAIAIEVLGITLMAGMSALHYGTIRLDYELRHYIVTDRSIRIREGAMHVREMTLTHANVQNLRIEQGPLQRLLGISDLVIDTAGGGGAGPQPGAEGHAALGHHAAFTGIEEPEVIRDLIRAHMKRTTADAGLGDDARRAKAKPPAAPALAPAAWTPALLDALRGCVTAAMDLRATATRASDVQPSTSTQPSSAQPASAQPASDAQLTSDAIPAADPGGETPPGPSGRIVERREPGL